VRLLRLGDNQPSAIPGTLNATDGRHATDSGYYDLQGRKVLSPAKGLYLRNGRKVVVE